MTEQELEEYKRLNSIEHKDVKGDKKLKDIYSNWANYLMILLMVIVQVGISVLSNVDGDITNAFPHTTKEWIIWSALRVISAVVAYMIFDSFVKEGEKQGKNSEEYKTAHNRYLEAFKLNKSKDVKILSPTQYLTKTRGLKAVKLVGSAVLTGVAVSLSTITLDWTSLLGTVISIIMMWVWGYQKQLEVENYFTNDYPLWVAIQENKLKEINNDNNRQSNLQESTGTSTKE